jgi:hypothetical protein
LERVGVAWGRLQFSGPFAGLGGVMLQGLENNFGDITDNTGGRLEYLQIEHGQLTVFLRPR